MIWNSFVIKFNTAQRNRRPFIAMVLEDQKRGMDILPRQGFKLREFVADLVSRDWTKLVRAPGGVDGRTETAELELSP